MLQQKREEGNSAQTLTIFVTGRVYFRLSADYCKQGLGKPDLSIVQYYYFKLNIDVCELLFSKETAEEFFLLYFREI